MKERSRSVVGAAREPRSTLDEDRGKNATERENRHRELDRDGAARDVGLGVCAHGDEGDCSDELHPAADEHDPQFEARARAKLHKVRTEDAGESNEVDYQQRESCWLELSQLRGA